MVQKTTLTVFFLFLISFSYSQTVTIPDANFEQSLIDLNIDSDGTINQTVLLTDVATVTTLDVSSKKIKDLTGIESFTALTTLICHSNELTDLDLSKNTKLFNLNCDNNFLVNLNVKNGNNTTVKFGGGNYTALNNRLFCINVDTAAQFSPFVPGTTRWIKSDDEVKGFSDNCQGIDVMPFIASFPAPIIAILQDKADTNKDGKLLLGEIQSFVGDMDLSTITGITDLSFLNSFVNIKGLNLGSSTLASIDFSKFRDLKNLDLSDNDALQSLDLSNNPELASLAATGSDLLTSLDLSNNPLLKDLVLKNCPLVKALDISTISELDSLVAKGNATLNLITFGTQAGGVKNKQKGTAVNTKLKTIDLSNNALTTLDVSSFPNVKKILVNGNSLTSLKVNNGNNVNIINANFDAKNNNLTSITVDDATFSTTNWTNIDAGTTFISGTLSVDSDVLASMVKIYPNPFTDYIKLELNTGIVVKEVSLKDVTGKSISNFSLKNIDRIDVSHLSNGMYLLVVKTDQGILSKKIVK